MVFFFLFRFISGGGFKVLSHQDVIIAGLFTGLSEVGQLKNTHTVITNFEVGLRRT